MNRYSNNTHGLRTAHAATSEEEKMDRKAAIMAHMVAWYPDEKKSLTVAEALLSGGVSYIEVQFPFSDPTADGPVIQQACTQALEAGFTTEKGFNLVSRIVQQTTVPLFIMSYAGPVYIYGIERFVKKAQQIGVAGLIVPDLMPGADEGLYEAGEKRGLPIVPVVVPSMLDQRLTLITTAKPDYMYAALRSGITGMKTDLSGVSGFLEKVKESRSTVFAGFGIQSRDQVEKLMGKADALVIGSAFVRIVEQTADCGETMLFEKVQQEAERFVYGNPLKNKIN
jgi:tryptophan synthase alpha chain